MEMGFRSKFNQNVRLIDCNAGATHRVFMLNCQHPQFESHRLFKRHKSMERLTKIRAANSNFIQKKATPKGGF